MACDPVGVVEIAEMLGVSRQRVNQLMHTYADFPEPMAELAMGRLWHRADIENWVRSHPRPTGRPKSAGASGSSGANRPPSGGAGGSGGGRKRRGA